MTGKEVCRGCDARRSRKERRERLNAWEVAKLHRRLLFPLLYSLSFSLSFSLSPLTCAQRENYAFFTLRAMPDQNQKEQIWKVKEHHAAAEPQFMLPFAPLPPRILFNLYPSSAAPPAQRISPSLPDATHPTAPSWRSQFRLKSLRFACAWTRLVSFCATIMLPQAPGGGGPAGTAGTPAAAAPLCSRAPSWAVVGGGCAPAGAAGQFCTFHPSISNTHTARRRFSTCLSKGVPLSIFFCACFSSQVWKLILPPTVCCSVSSSISPTISSPHFLLCSFFLFFPPLCALLFGALLMLILF